MNTSQQTRLSKILSKYLRHAPHELGLTLEEGGWVSAAELIAALRTRGVRTTLDELRATIASSDKQRFALDEERGLIRANQGHSAQVDLQLTPATPPDVLYHGTPEKNLDAIFSGGLRKMRRHHVHLSGDEETARKVGARRGPPVILQVDARGMHEAGHVFYRSANGVWLTDEVPSQFLAALTAR